MDFWTRSSRWLIWNLDLAQPTIGDATLNILHLLVGVFVLLTLEVSQSVFLLAHSAVSFHCFWRYRRLRYFARLYRGLRVKANRLRVVCVLYWSSISRVARQRLDVSSLRGWRHQHFIWKTGNSSKRVFWYCTSDRGSTFKNRDLYGLYSMCFLNRSVVKLLTKRLQRMFFVFYATNVEHPWEIGSSARLMFLWHPIVFIVKRAVLGHHNNQRRVSCDQ